MLDWIKTLASNFITGSNQDREDFQSFLFHETMNNASLNLDDALNLYIKKYNLMIRTHLDEPENISLIRTKHQIMEEMVFIEPDFAKNPQIMAYVTHARLVIDGFNSLIPEYLKPTKE